MLVRVLIFAVALVTALVEGRSQECCSHGNGSLSMTNEPAFHCLQRGDDVTVQENATEGCATAVGILANFPTLAIDSTEGEVRDYRTGETGLGCRVEMKGSAATFQRSGQPDVALREEFAGLGWTEDYEYGADGPDGSAFAFRKGSVLCVFRAHWDGGDDSDPTYVPEDRYDVEVDCLSSG